MSVQSECLGDIMRAESNEVDLQKNNITSRLEIYAQKKDKTLYRLGFISYDALYRWDRSMISQAIDRIKYSRFLKEYEQC